MLFFKYFYYLYNSCNSFYDKVCLIMKGWAKHSRICMGPSIVTYLSEIERKRREISGCIADAFEVCNYRPISILSVPSKILERHVHSTFNSYLESHHLITTHQSGFRPKHSCDTTLLKMTDDWLCNVILIREISQA